MDDRPIGVFDSGLGGLTALLELRRLMPEENIVYFGDTGRLPYGEKTLAQLRVMAAQDLRLMAEQDVKAILVACGTLSSNTPELLEAFPIPTAGVLVPSIRAMAEAPGDGALGIIATAATIRSGAFERALRKACPGREIIPIPCPKLVPLIEFGHTDPEDPLLQEALEEYTAPLQKASAVLLGCTHYGIVAEGLRRLLPEDFLSVPKLGSINLHGSLLPRWRGAAPIQQAVLDGEAVTGVTTMLMDVGLDTGDILLKAETPIGENETAGELFDRLAQLGGELILKTLDKLEKGEITPQKQDESLATHTSKIDKSYCPIDFSKPAREVHNKVRGLYPWPVATAVICGKRVRIHATRLNEKSGKAGTVLSVKPLLIACGEGSVELVTIQPEGKKPMTAEAFLAGHKLAVGESVQ